MPTDLPTVPYPDDATFRRIGKRVFVALTEEDRATLKESIEGAIRAARIFDSVSEDVPLNVPDGDPHDDWLSALSSAECWDGCDGPVDDAVMLDVCRTLGRAKTRRKICTSSWDRLVGGGFGEEARERIQKLYANIPLGSSVRWL
ncbi:hypothetical protein ASF22_22460 [Methylobacterium sp. Leaf87]|uniref:hypothetical protein n=1 Tax=Methylobacterium sp. Leaf87 TaxID=1736243 RepID=UPI0006FA59B5|nr:hypothetical protein [Methylobacterium sp. Leaf87]KQO60177.1 hypothetical protein ASF22_22460 [Methylobacterium sp. Leaf87]